MTMSDAAHDWVSEMNAYPTDMIRRLIEIDPYDWEEVTEPDIGDRVSVCDFPDGCENYFSEGIIEDIITDCDKYLVSLDDGNSVELKAEDFEVYRYDDLPMWGYMWSFGDSIDDYWLEDLDGIKKMSQCGFRIYHNEEWGYFFGIDGAGYDFYESHWIPLYKERGLQWHDAK